MKKLFFVLLLLGSAGLAHAQYSEYYIFNKCFSVATSSLNVKPISSLEIGSSFATGPAASITSVVNNINTGLAGFTFVSLCNTGSKSIYVDFSGAVATTSSVPIRAGACFSTYFNSGTNAQISAITGGADTSTLDWYVQK